MTDILYYVRPGENNEELRHSLRSLQNLPHDRVLIAGHKPKWVQNVIHIPNRQKLNKYKNAVSNIETALASPHLTGDFTIFNDDMYVMKPIDQVPTFHMGELQAYIKNFSVQNSSYHVAAKNTLKFLQRLGVKTPFFCYSTHTPMQLNKYKMIELMKLVRRDGYGRQMHLRTAYGNLFKQGGTAIEDVKNRTPNEPYDLDATFLSTNDHTFTHGPIGEHIRLQLQAPCTYECQ